MPQVPRVMVAFSDDTRERIEKILEYYEFRSRAHFIDAAVERYLDELEEEIDQEEDE